MGYGLFVGFCTAEKTGHGTGEINHSTGVETQIEDFILEFLDTLAKPDPRAGIWLRERCLLLRKSVRPFHRDIAVSSGLATQ